MVTHVLTEEGQVVLTFLENNESEVLLRGSIEQCKQDLKDKFKLCPNASWVSDTQFEVLTDQGDGGYIISLMMDNSRITTTIDIS